MVLLQDRTTVTLEFAVSERDVRSAAALDARIPHAAGPRRHPKSSRSDVSIVWRIAEASLIFLSGSST